MKRWHRYILKLTSACLLVGMLLAADLALAQTGAVICTGVTNKSQPEGAGGWFKVGVKELVVWFKAPGIIAEGTAEVRWLLNSATLKTADIKIREGKAAWHRLQLGEDEILPKGRYEALVTVDGRRLARVYAQIGGTPPEDDDSKGGGLRRAPRTDGAPPAEGTSPTTAVDEGTPPPAPVVTNPTELTPTELTPTELIPVAPVITEPVLDASAPEPPVLSNTTGIPQETMTSDGELPSALNTQLQAAVTKPEPVAAPITKIEPPIVTVPTATLPTGTSPVPIPVVPMPVTGALEPGGNREIMPAPEAVNPLTRTAEVTPDRGMATAQPIVQSETRVLPRTIVKTTLPSGPRTIMVRPTGMDLPELMPAPPEPEVAKPSRPMRPTAVSIARLGNTPDTLEPAIPDVNPAPSVENIAPVKPEPVKPEPVKPEPVKPEPVKPEPVKPEPVKPEPVIAPEIPVVVPVIPENTTPEITPEPVTPTIDVTPVPEPENMDPIAFGKTLLADIVAEDALPVELGREAVKLYRVTLSQLEKPAGLQPMWVVRVPDNRLWPVGMPMQLGLFAGNNPDPSPANLMIYSDHEDGLTPLYVVPEAEAMLLAARENDPNLLVIGRDMYDQRQKAWLATAGEWRWMWFAREVELAAGQVVVGAVANRKRSARAPEAIGETGGPETLLLDEAGNAIEPVELSAEATGALASAIGERAVGNNASDFRALATQLQDKGTESLRAWRVPAAGRYQVWLSLPPDVAVAQSQVWIGQ